jgi:hypothetical protein
LIRSGAAPRYVPSLPTPRRRSYVGNPPTIVVPSRNRPCTRRTAIAAEAPVLVMTPPYRSHLGADVGTSIDYGAAPKRHDLQTRRRRVGRAHRIPVVTPLTEQQILTVVGEQREQPVCVVV